MWKWIKALNPFESDNYHPWMREEIAALRAELAAAEIELADLRFYQREFAAVSEERDGLKKRNDIQAEQLIRIDSEISPLMSEVAELKAELAELKAQPGGWELDVTAEELDKAWVEKYDLPSFLAYATAAIDYLASRIRPAAPRAYTDADVEKLARVLCESNMDEWRHRSKEHIQQARAALDWVKENWSAQ